MWFISWLFAYQASATILNIDSMDNTSGHIIRSFNPNDLVTLIALDFTGNTNLVGGLINKDTTSDGLAIAQTNFRKVKDPDEPTRSIYTASTNIRYNNEWIGAPPPADDTITDSSFVAPTVVDAVGTITMSLSSWFANGMVMNIGGIVTGIWDPATGAISV